MTKKHFEALAAAFKAGKPQVKNQAQDQWHFDALMVTEVCARFNPNFDRTRFLTACGVEN